MKKLPFSCKILRYTSRTTEEKQKSKHQLITYYYYEKLRLVFNAAAMPHAPQR